MRNLLQVGAMQRGRRAWKEGKKGTPTREKHDLLKSIERRHLKVKFWRETWGFHEKSLKIKKKKRKRKAVKHRRGGDVAERIAIN